LWPHLTGLVDDLDTIDPILIEAASHFSVVSEVECVADVFEDEEWLSLFVGNDSDVVSC
jgi:hypothetical protein